MNPQSIIPELEKMKEMYVEKNLKRGQGRPTIRTKEGVEAVFDAIEYLGSCNMTQALNWSPEMAQAAKDHVLDIGPKGLITHTSTEGENIKAKQRLRRYGQIISCYGESMSFTC